MVINPPNGPIVLGDIPGKLTIIPGTRFRKNAFGTDQLSVPVMCLTSEFRGLLPNRYSVNSDYPGMYFIDFDQERIEGLMTKATLNYLGSNGQRVDVLSENVLTVQSVAVRYTVNDVETGVSASYDLLMQYKAPTTNYKWVETSAPPQEPRYSALRSSLNPWDNYVTRNVVDNASGSASPVSAEDAFITLKGRGVVESVMEYRTTEVVPGRYWECSSSISRLIDGISASKTVNI